MAVRGALRLTRARALAIPLVASLLLPGFARAGEQQLIGDDLGRLRREALDLFPRGKPVGQVAQGLKALGFRCSPTKIVLANISAPTIACDSAGRGYPTTPRIEITIIARNGALADIAVGDGLHSLQADARTPDGPPRDAPAPAAKEAPAKSGH